MSTEEFQIVSPFLFLRPFDEDKKDMSDYEKFYWPKRAMILELHKLHTTFKARVGNDDLMSEKSQKALKNLYLTQETPYHPSGLYPGLMDKFREEEFKKDDDKPRKLGIISKQISIYASNVILAIQELAGSTFHAYKVWNFDTLSRMVIDISDSKLNIQYLDMTEIGEYLRSNKGYEITTLSNNILEINGFHFECSRALQTEEHLSLIKECSNSNIMVRGKNVYYRDMGNCHEARRFIITCLAMLSGDKDPILAYMNAWIQFYEIYRSHYSNDLIVVLEDLRYYLPKAYFTEYVLNEEKTQESDVLRNVWIRMKRYHGMVDYDDMKTYSYVNCQPWLTGMDYSVSNYVIATYLTLRILGNILSPNAQMIKKIINDEFPHRMVEKSIENIGGFKDRFKIPVNSKEIDELDAQELDLIVEAE